MRKCNNCALCCKLIEVTALQKEAWKWCVHCTKHSCEIFEKEWRPIACSSYKCEWLLNESMDESLRPDRCKVIFEKIDKENYIALIDPSRPDAWLSNKKVKEVIIEMLESNYAISISNKKETHLILPKDRSSEDVLKALGDKWLHQPTIQI